MGLFGFGNNEKKEPVNSGRITWVAPTTGHEYYEDDAPSCQIYSEKDSFLRFISGAKDN